MLARWLVSASSSDGHHGCMVGRMPSTRETYRRALKLAEDEFLAARDALAAEDTERIRRRYTLALARRDRLQAAFPFVEKLES